jgi:hypothetical protein
MPVKFRWLLQLAAASHALLSPLPQASRRSRFRVSPQTEAPLLYNSHSGYGLHCTVPRFAL